MNKVLLIEVSPNGEASASRAGGKILLERLRAKGPVEVIKHDLATETVPHIDGHTVGSFYTPEHVRTEDQKKLIELSEKYVTEVLNADTIVITTPMWNFGTPSILKAWIDHIVRVGKTFSFEGGTLKGMLSGKKVYVVISAGSVYTSGPMQSFDHIGGYFKSVFGFMGVGDVHVLWVEGTNRPDVKDAALANFQTLLAEV